MAVHRRLAAILAADVAGYARLMGADEEGTLEGLTAHRTELVEPAIAEHRGRVVKTTGDGLLAEFASVVDAVRCAVAVQEGMAARNAGVPEDRRIAFRIGVNLGDVIVQEGDVYGEGVNVAARLEGLAAPGGICISGAVHEQVRHRLGLAFEDMGEQTVKNIADPVRVYRIRAKASDAAPGEAQPAQALFARPAVAVLPFENLSGDPDQEYFADGLTEDIITALSLWRSFPVIARNSTFAYKGVSPDVRKLGEELGARYVVEGSVRKAGPRIRVTAQLIDSETGHHLWADRYDRNVEDIFAVQDEITARVAATIEPAVERAEQRRAMTHGRGNLDAWACYQRGMSFLLQFTKDSKIAARAEFARAMALDAGYARAYAGMAWSYSADLLTADTDSPDGTLALAIENAQRAAALDDGDSMVQLVLSICYPWAGKLEMALLSAEKAVALNPSNAEALAGLGNMLDLLGRPDDGIAKLLEGIALNPQDPVVYKSMTFLARAYVNARRYEDAAAWAQKAVHRQPDWPNAHYIHAVALAHLGRIAEARAALEDCERAQPGFAEKRRAWCPYRDQAANEHILEGLRKSGWPG